MALFADTPTDRHARRLAIAAGVSASIILLTLGLRLASHPAILEWGAGPLLVALGYAWIAARGSRGGEAASVPLVLGVATAMSWVALAVGMIELLLVLPMARIPGTQWPLFIIGALPDPSVIIDVPLPAGLAPRIALGVLLCFVATQVVALQAVRLLARTARVDVRYWWGTLAGVVAVGAAARFAPGGVLSSAPRPGVAAEIRQAGVEAEARDTARVAEEWSVARVLDRVNACAHRFASRPDGHGYPTSLAAIGPTGDRCVPAAELRDSVVGWTIAYAAAAPDSSGVVAGYRLEARPRPGSPMARNVGGSLTSDERALVRHPREGLAGASTYTPIGALLELRDCLEMYHLQRAGFGYPASLITLSSAGNGCLRGEPFHPSADSTTLLLSGSGYRYRAEYARLPADTAWQSTGIALSLRPLKYGDWGVRSYALDDSGRVHVTADDRAATAADPVLPLCGDHTIGGDERDADECQHWRSLPPPNRDVAPVLRLSPRDTALWSGSEIPWHVVIDNAWLGNGPYDYTIVWSDGRDSVHAHTSDRGGEGWFEPGRNPVELLGRPHPLYTPGRYTMRVSVTDRYGRTTRDAATVTVSVIPIRVDVLPGDRGNVVRLRDRSQRRLPVVIFSGGPVAAGVRGFDGRIFENGSLTVGRTRLELETHRDSVEHRDVDGDGMDDLVLWMDRRALEKNGDLRPGRHPLVVRAMLIGSTRYHIGNDGRLVGADTVRVVR